MMNLDDCRVNSLNFHILIKLIFVESVLWTFYHFGFYGSGV